MKQFKKTIDIYNQCCDEKKFCYLGRSPISSKAAALIFRVSVLFFEAKSHLHFVLAFTQQR